MNKILYRIIEGQHKFYGLVGMPEQPNYDEQIPDWKMICSEIKSTAPEIINREDIPGLKSEITTDGVYYTFNGRVLKDNDIFDLPEGMEFVEMYASTARILSTDNKHLTMPIRGKVLRIVKAEKEPEESKEDHIKIAYELGRSDFKALLREEIENRMKRIDKSMDVEEIGIYKGLESALFIIEKVTPKP